MLLRHLLYLLNPLTDKLGKLRVERNLLLEYVRSFWAGWEFTNLYWGSQFLV